MANQNQKQESAAATSRPVLVTTEYRGVFYGMLAKDADYNHDARRIVVDQARNVIYWSGTRGFLGLASGGPEKGSKLGAKAGRVELHGVTSVADVSDAAWKAAAAWTA